MFKRRRFKQTRSLEQRLIEEAANTSTSSEGSSE